MAKNKLSKQAGSGNSTEGKEKTSMYIDIPTLESLRYIAYKENITRTDIVSEALVDYISKWEKKNGLIPR